MGEVAGGGGVKRACGESRWRTCVPRNLGGCRPSPPPTTGSRSRAPTSPSSRTRASGRRDGWCGSSSRCGARRRRSSRGRRPISTGRSASSWSRTRTACARSRRSIGRSGARSVRRACGTGGPDGTYIALRARRRGRRSRDAQSVHGPRTGLYIDMVLGQSIGRDLPLWFRRGFTEVLSNTIVADDHILYRRADSIGSCRSCASGRCCSCRSC